MIKTIALIVAASAPVAVALYYKKKAANIQAEMRQRQSEAIETNNTLIAFQANIDYLEECIFEKNAQIKHLTILCDDYTAQNVAYRKELLTEEPGFARVSMADMLLLKRYKGIISKEEYISKLKELER